MTNLATSTATSGKFPNPMDWLFGELHGLFGNKLLDAFRSGHTVDGLDTGIENMKRVWAEKIRANDLKMADVRAGLKAAERLKWPPTWGEFLEICKPSVNIDAAIYEAIEQIRLRQQGEDQWSNAAFYWAAIKVGERDMLGQTFSQIKPLFERALKVVLSGEVLPVPPRVARLEAPEKTPEQMEQDRLRIDAIARKAYTPAKSVREVMGNIGWARRIVEDNQAGGKVPLNKLRIAREAIFNVTGVEA